MRHIVGARKAWVQRSSCTVCRNFCGSQWVMKATLAPALITGRVTLYQPMKAVESMLHMASAGDIRHR